MTKSTITREPITHDIKIYPEFFSAVCTGVKRAELRKNDRDYRVGDTLHLMETPRGSCHQTGEFINVKITHIADVGEWMPGYVLLSVELQERRKADSEPVAWTWHYREQWHVTNDKCRAEFVAKDGDVAVLPLYRHAQPAPEKYNIGEATMLHIFTATGMTDASDMQAVFDRVEAVLAELLDKLRIAESDRDKNGWYVHECARLERQIESAAQPAPVVPDERDKAVDADDHPLLWSFNEGWNACRAAMLSGGKS